MIYIFNNNDELLEIIDNYISAEMERELNGDWTFNFGIDINISENIKRKNKVGFYIDDKFYLFSIEEIEDTYFSEDIKKIYCHNDIFNLNNYIIEDKRCNNYTVDKTLEKVLEGTEYNVGNVDSFDSNTCNFYYVSSLGAIKTIVEVYGCEYDVRIEYNTNTNTLEKYIDLKMKLGEETGLRFTYDTNLVSIKRTEVADNHYNVLYGRGGSLALTDENGEETGGHTRLIDFADVEWSISNNNPCNKPLKQKYVEDLNSIQKYGRLEGIYENQDITDTKILLQATYDKLQETKEPSVSYEVNVNDLSSVEGFQHYNYTLGDRIIILDEDYNIDLESRIIKELIDIKEKNKTVTLGYVLPSQSSITANGSIVSSSDNNTSTEDKTITDENFPNTLPKIPTVTIDREGFSSISLSWTFENKSYYVYEVYASQSENFNPTENHLIFKGHASTFLHEAGFNQTYYYRVRCTNSHNQSTDFSDEVSATTRKIDDATEVFENLAIKDALIGKLRLDRGWVGKLDATNLDVKGKFSIMNGNEVKTFEVDDFGDVSINAKTINMTVGDTETTLNDWSISTENKFIETTNNINENIDNAIQDSTNSTLATIDGLYAKKDDLESFQSTVSSQFKQTENDISMKFTRSIEATDKVNNNLEEYKETVGTHIRFSENGIELGKSNSPFMTVLDNEKLAFKQYNEEIAYINNNKMHITQAEIKETLRIGRETENKNGFFSWTQDAKGNLLLKWSEK